MKKKENNKHGGHKRRKTHYHSAVEGTVFTHVHAVIYNAIFRKFMRRNNGLAFISVFECFSIIIYTDSGLF